MASLQRQQRSRTGWTRPNRGSCSSTASCPVFSGSYSDHEEEPPLRRQSSPLLKGSLSSLQSSSNTSPKDSLSSLQGSVPCLSGSLSVLQGSLSRSQNSSLNNRGSPSRVKRRSLSNLDNSSTSEGSTCPSVLSRNASSSDDDDDDDDDDDGSWDTNSWGSGATCLLRTPIKQDIKEVSLQSSEDPCIDGQRITATRPEDEIIYQNLIFALPAVKAEKKSDCVFKRTCTAPRKDTGTQSMSSSCHNKNLSSVFSQDQEKNEDKRKFSQFLNEVTCRVLKSKGGPPNLTTLRHHLSSPPPPPPPPPSMSAPSHPPLHSARINPPPLSTSGTKLWCSPTSSNLITIKKQDIKAITSSIHQWSKALPSCKILESADVLKDVKRESHSYLEHDREPCGQIQAQSSTGRRYLETDIDRVRRLDEMIVNATLGKERNENITEKEIETGKEKKNGTPCQAHRASKIRKGKEKELKILQRDGAAEQKKEKNKRRGTPSWETDRRIGGRQENEKRILLSSYGTLPPELAFSKEANRCPFSSWPDGFPRISHGSTSRPRPVNIIESDGEMQLDTSSFLEPKDDLRKQLPFTTPKLQMVETELNSTHHYLETELHRAKEQLEEFTEKLRRIQSSYAALQKVNQDLEDRMRRTSQHHEEETRALNRKIILLNNLLMEAKITVNKLRRDNLPQDIQERFMEKNSGGGSATNVAMCHSNYSDVGPTTITAKVLEKPEPGSSCPITHSPGPQPQDGDFLTLRESTNQLDRLIAYKTSDLYCSDTALYCPERWQDTERRQSVDLHFSDLLQHHAQNDSMDDQRGVIGGCVHTASRNLSSSHQGLYTDWEDGKRGDHTPKSLSSCDDGSSCFPKSQSIQLLVAPTGPQKSSSPAYTRTTSCIIEPYHSSTPHLGSSHSMASTTGFVQDYRGAVRDARVAEDDLSVCWRQLSMEDINTFSSSYNNITGRVPPFGFSKQHVGVGLPSKFRGSLYGSSQEGDPFLSHAINHCFPVGSPSHGPSVMYRAKDNSQDYKCSLFLSGSSKDKESSGGVMAGSNSKKEHANLSADNSVESFSFKHYTIPRPGVRPCPSSSSALSIGPALPKKTSSKYQISASTGMTRKDSLTKAQLYGTLLN